MKRCYSPLEFTIFLFVSALAGIGIGHACNSNAWAAPLKGTAITVNRNTEVIRIIDSETNVFCYILADSVRDDVANNPKSISCVQVQGVRLEK